MGIISVFLKVCGVDTPITENVVILPLSDYVVFYNNSVVSISKKMPPYLIMQVSKFTYKKEGRHILCL